MAPDGLHVSPSPAASPTLAGAHDGLARRGFTEHLTVVGGKLHALESGRSFAPDEVVIREYHRFEGVSDPDDMSIVYAIETRDATRGTLVDAFGVYSNPVVGAFLREVRSPGRSAGARDRAL